MNINTVSVGLGSRAYPILIGQTLLDQVGTRLREMGIGKRCGVIGDDRVAGLYGERVMKSLADSRSCSPSRPEKDQKISPPSARWPVGWPGRVLTGETRWWRSAVASAVI